ncbi:8361_t:CDS:2 [Cetraspora pellucida]|uniref:8361_t:CDS:1 n=1 Tax=Cetraspora pellucida TaxID=1433469 RepID=A0ACA9NLM4_9GLOM|nr:8361_t:CDS:2 [Cetraspora pellucida]
MEESYALPEPGEIITYDFRKIDKFSQNKDPKIIESTTSFKCLQWNVERNYCSSQILSNLKELDPDIAFIQEIDIYCKRSGNKNHFKEIASKLGWKGGFVSEFIELESELRKDRDQGGGVHGNAIFTKHEITFRVLDHKHHPLDWEKQGTSLCEPRKGRRFTLVAEVKPPFGPPILCYCVHLEVFCGIVGRISQFSDILLDSTNHINSHPYQLIFGDLNTMGHSIARLSPLYCTDRYRILSLGLSESEWWDINLFDWHINDGDINLKLQAGGSWILAKLLKYFYYNNDNTNSDQFYSQMNNYIMSGFTLDVLRAARNPGFYDPWSPTRDITLANKNYFGLYSAKLDWTLLCGFEVVNRWIGNDDYSASDHKYMMVEIKFEVDKISSSSKNNSWKMKRSYWKKELDCNENDNLGRWLKYLGIGISVSIFIFNVLRRR